MRLTHRTQILLLLLAATISSPFPAAKAQDQSSVIENLRKENKALREENERLRSRLRSQVRGISSLGHNSVGGFEGFNVLNNWDTFTTDSRTRDTEYKQLNFNDARQMNDEIAALETPFNIRYNDAIKKYLEIYTVQKKDNMTGILTRYRTWQPTLEDTFRKKDIPECITMLALVESAMNARAVSSAGAVGMWQFLYDTALSCGLKIAGTYDERLDPNKSTAAAATYLSRAFQRFGSWDLAVMSYNCGAGAVENAVKRSGGKTSFDDIRQYLPRETQEYLPALIAALIVNKYANDLDILPTVPEPQPPKRK